LGSTEPHAAWGIAGEPKPRANPGHSNTMVWETPLLDEEKAKACRKLNLIRPQLHNYIEARGIPAAARGQRGA